MELRILLKRLAGRLVISAGRMLEIELLGALSVIEEDTVIAVYQLGEYGMNFSEFTFFWLFFTPLPCFSW